MIRVLVVDDDFMVARIHTAFVTKVDGFVVVASASTGKAALTAATDLRPDLVLLDLYLPDGHGLDLLPRLREACPDLDAVVISAAKDVETVRRAARGGIIDYLIKPFTQADLRERLESYAHASVVRGGSLAQHEADMLVGRAGGAPHLATQLPKRLSPETARLIEQTLRDSQTDLSAAECATAAGLSRVSARRYLEHFVASGLAQVRLQYGEVGRPERRYRWAAAPAGS